MAAATSAEQVKGRGSTCPSSLKKKGCGALAHLPMLIYGSPMRISRNSLAIIVLGFLAYAGLLLFHLIFGADALAQSNPLPRNEQIMYGDRQFSPPELKANKELLQSVDRLGVSRRDAARRAVVVGFKHFREGDIASAIKRFNQGWLIDPEFGRVYWGLAIVSFERNKDPVQAEQLFLKAAELSPDDADLHVDVGRFFGKTGNPSKAGVYFERALKIDEDVRDAHRGLALAYASQMKFRQALDHAKIAKQRGETLKPNAVPFLACLVGMIEKGLELNQKNAALCADP